MVVDLCLPNSMNPLRLICAICAILDFLYLAQYPVHSSTTLDLLTDSLSHFHENKDIFIDLGVREHFNIPKLHYLKHYMNFIKLHGTTDNYNTKYTERLHIDLVKDAYQSTNQKDEYSQMTIWLERIEKLWHHTSYIQWRLDGKPTPSWNSEEKPPQLSLAKYPSHYGVSLQSLIQDYGATEFSDAFTWYWVKLT